MKRNHPANKTIHLPQSYAVIFPHGAEAASFASYIEAERFQAYVAKHFLIPSTIKAV